jgi:hypothetical protein
MKRLEVVPFVRVPVGWMRCVACSDFRTQPGRMWLGYSKTWEDLTIECPQCHGTAQVERFKHIDVREPGRRSTTSGPGRNSSTPTRNSQAFNSHDNEGAITWRGNTQSAETTKPSLPPRNSFT